MTEKYFEEENFSKHVDFAVWRRLFRYTLPYRCELALLAVFAITTAALEVSFPLLTKHVIDSFGEAGFTEDVLTYGLIYLALMMALTLSVIMFFFMAGKIRTYVGYDIRRDGFANLQRLSFSYYDQRPVGWLMARMTSDCDRLSQIMAWGVLDFIWGSAMMIGIAVAMLILHPLMALLVFTILPVLAWVSLIFQKRILHSSRQVRRINSNIIAGYNESIMAVRTSKVFTREPRNLQEFQTLSEDMYSASMRNALQSALYLPIILTLGSLAIGFALVSGGVSVIAGVITLGTLIAFMNYARQFFEPIEELAAWFAEMQMAQAAAERILGLISEQPEIQDSTEVRQRYHVSSETAAGVYSQQIQEIELRNVEFAYKKGESILSDINLKVRSGETIALVGPTGGGKSTLVNLICRFYEPTRGEVLIDGVDYRQRGLHWLQSNLGMVLQSAHIFSGTIADNIRYGDLAADDRQIEAAAKLAAAHDFIMAMPKGYATEVGEGGILLSSGQKQMISFARAILAKAQIMVLDEATSSVDTETEQRIQQGLIHVLAGRISFVIAHRLSTIRSADKILVIEKGRIKEQGSHQELIALRGHYYELYTQQSLREVALSDDSWEM